MANELLGKAFVNDQKEPIIEYVRASLIEKTTYVAIELKKFDTLSSDNLMRVKGAQDKLPEELLIQRAAYAITQSDSL